MMLKFSPIQSNIIDACGPASLCMILQHYGLKISTKEILDMHGGLETVTTDGIAGTYVIENATIAAQHGFKVNAHSANGKIVGLKGGFTNHYVLDEKIREQLATATGIDREILVRYQRAKEHGVNLMLMNPCLTEIKDYIEKQVPLHISVNPNILYDTNTFSPNAGHSIVVTGITNDKVRFADPDTGKHHFVAHEVLMAALQTYATSHSAYLIAITPKK